MKKKNTVFYPRLESLGVQVKDGIVSRKELRDALVKNNVDLQKFSEYFGVQTAPLDGYFALDVESVLERMFSGKLIGTQAEMD